MTATAPLGYCKTKTFSAATPVLLDAATAAFLTAKWGSGLFTVHSLHFNSHYDGTNSIYTALICYAENTP